MPIFEQEVRGFLDKHFPCCALSNFPIFRPDAPVERTKGYEIDHLIHVQSDAGDRLIVIECKDAAVRGEGPGNALTDEGKWIVDYPDGPKDIKRRRRMGSRLDTEANGGEWGRDLTRDREPRRTPA